MIRRAIALGSVSLIGAAAFAVSGVSHVSAGYTNNCSTAFGSQAVATEGPVTVYEGTGRTGTSGTTAAGVCVAGPGETGGLPVGGDAEVGVNPSNSYGVNYVTCPTGTATPPATNGCMPGAYAVVDGSDNNPGVAGFAQGQGYIGVSNFDTGTSGDGQGNAGCANGPGNCGSNSGGATSVKGTGVVLPLPIVCGDTSGTDWDNSNRDGCFVP